MLFVKQLSTVMGGEAGSVWRRFVKRDEEIAEGEPGAERRRQEREARRIWKRYRRCMWWVDNSNPMLRGAAEEPGIREPEDLHDFLEEIKRRFRQSSSEYVMKLETFRPKPGTGSRQFSATSTRLQRWWRGRAPTNHRCWRASSIATCHSRVNN